MSAHSKSELLTHWLDDFTLAVLRAVAQFWNVSLSFTSMPSWLLIWIARWTSGERFRKATSEDYRWHFSTAFFSGVLMIIGMTLGSTFLEHASAISIWICGTAVVIASYFGATAWARFVPAVISLVLAIIAWGAFAWIFLEKTLWL